jgi:uncharacterized membrane protein
MDSTLQMVALGWWYWVLIAVLVAIIIIGLAMRKKET